MESELLREAVETGRFDPMAAETCAGLTLSEAETVASVDSTSAEVREIASQVDAPPGWDKYLPPEPDNYIALCILDVAGLDTPLGDPDYVAYWIGDGDTDGGTIGGTAILTFWETSEGD
jgi:hypothetical protein